MGYAMAGERLSKWLGDLGVAAPDGAIKGLLSALWSFLQHPATAFDDHLTALEERLSGLESRLVGDFQAGVERGIVAVEESVASVERRLNDDFRLAIRGRISAIQARLDAIRSRVVENLKHEVHRILLMLALAAGCGLLGLVGMIFALMAAWMILRGYVGATGASVILAALFLIASLIVFRVLHSMLHRSQPPPSAKNTET
jgi:hypothetical protein